jgi:putative peptidoglycan lipid II flippase
VLYQHGAFGADASAALAPLLAISVVGMPFFSVVSLTTRAFYALKDTRTPVKIATVSFVLNTAGSLVFMHYWGAAGLMLAGTLAVIVQCLCLQRLLNRAIPGMSLGVLRRDIAKLLLASLGMGLFVSAIWWLGLQAKGRLGDWLALLVLIPSAVLVYGGLLWLMKVGGLEEFAEMAARFKARLSGRNKER